MEPTQGTSEVVKALAAYGGLYREERASSEDALSDAGIRVFRSVMQDESVLKPTAPSLSERMVLLETIRGNIDHKAGLIIGVSKRTLTTAKAALTALAFDLNVDEGDEFKETVAALNRMTILGEERAPQQREEAPPIAVEVASTQVEETPEGADIELPPMVQLDLGFDLPSIVINQSKSSPLDAPTALDLRTPEEGMARVVTTPYAPLRPKGPTEGHRQFEAIVDKFSGRPARNAQGRFIGFEIAKFESSKHSVRPSVVKDEGHEQIGMRPKEAENLMRVLHQRTTGHYSEGSFALYRILLVRQEGKLYVKTIDRSIGESRSIDGRQNGVKYYEVRDTDDMVTLFGLDKDLDTQGYVDYVPYK